MYSKETRLPKNRPTPSLASEREKCNFESITKLPSVLKGIFIAVTAISLSL